MRDAKDTQWNALVRLPAKPYFISTDTNKVQKFINLLQQYAVAIEWFNTNTMTALNTATRLDSIIRKEYHLFEKIPLEK